MKYFQKQNRLKNRMITNTVSNIFITFTNEIQ